MNTKYFDLYTDYLAVTFESATSTGLSNMLDSLAFLPMENGVRKSVEFANPLILYLAFFMISLLSSLTS